MTRILYIAASPRAEMSQSGKLAEAYLAARQAAEPNLTIDRLDL
jgi:FMN-dependent NADH-azoreductase